MLRPCCMSGSLTLGGGKTFPAFPDHAQPAILRICQETHCVSEITTHDMDKLAGIKPQQNRTTRQKCLQLLRCTDMVTYYMGFILLFCFVSFDCGNSGFMMFTTYIFQIASLALPQPRNRPLKVKWSGVARAK